jgi:hypothetical protein
MRLARRMRSRSSLRRRALAAGPVVLLLIAVAACGPAGRATAGRHADDAVDTLLGRESVTLVASLDGRPEQVAALLEATGRPPTDVQARLLSRAELTVALEADGPLRDLEKFGPGTRLAMSLNFGDMDVFAYKSVNKRVYLRVRPNELAREAGLTQGERRQVRRVVRMADALPGSLGSAVALLKGRWVKLDPDDFEDFEWAAGPLADVDVSEEEARKAGSVLDGEVPRRLAGTLRALLDEHARFGPDGAGTGDGVRKVTARLPARTAVRELSPVLEGLGIWLSPSEVPDRQVPVVLTVRRGELAGVSLDLARLVPGAGVETLPLRLDLATGDALSLRAPDGARDLRPQDLIAAFLFGALHSSGAGNQDGTERR